MALPFWENVTPDATKLLSGGRYLHAAGAGTIVVKDRDGSSFNLVGDVGAYHPFDTGYVMPSSTATGIVVVRG